MRYICLHCFHEWDSNGTRGIMRCSDCHRRQGIRYEKFDQAVKAAKAAFRKVADSPPPHRPPIEVISDIPDALGPVLEVARNEFPNPLVPITLFAEIVRRAAKEIKETSARDSPKDAPKLRRQTIQRDTKRDRKA